MVSRYTAETDTVMVAVSFFSADLYCAFIYLPYTDIAAVWSRIFVVGKSFAMGVRYRPSGTNSQCFRILRDMLSLIPNENILLEIVLYLS